jgi:hypothetical protein
MVWPGEMTHAAVPFPFAIDVPTADDPPARHTVVVAGWVAPPPDTRVEIQLRMGATTRPLDRVPRPDVEAVHPGTQVVGFSTRVSLAGSEVDGAWLVVVVVDGTEHTIPIPVVIDHDAVDAFRRSKEQKLDRLQPILRCPAIDHGSACRGELTRDDDVLECRHCARRYPATSLHFDFLTSELRTIGAADHTDNVSAHAYDDVALELIRSSELVLDVGAGLRTDYLDNVVNFEIASYPTSDVLGIGESLPFADGSVDGALSLAVLEHVRDPFTCAREIARVVRPGGRIYIVVPFLQPYHGYPNHFFNMTRQALVELFEPAFDIDDVGTPMSGVPVWTLTWILQRWAAQLPPEVAERFLDLRVRDLVGEPLTYLDADFVTQLPAAANEELASTNFLLGTRRVSGG